jgi:UDP-glucose 4-epimerase
VVIFRRKQVAFVDMSPLPPSWYRDRAVLVLGGLGFIGWNLSRQLARAGARLTVVTRDRSAHASEAAALESSGVRLVEADLRDAEAMSGVVDRQDVVFNLAAQSGATRSQEDPFTDLDVNCRGSLVLLEALRTAGQQAKLVFVGSRLEYGSVGAEPVGEDRPPDPLCLHAVHKLMVEKYLRIYERLFGLKFSVARVTNPYGPGQPAGRTAYGVVNHLIHVALTGQALTIYGDGSQRRDYIFIDDVVAALLSLGASSASDGRIYNVGTGVGTRLIDMARAIVSAAGGGRIELVRWPPMAEQIETGDFVADISRIRRETAWEPLVSLEDGLQRTVSFYRAHVTS